MIDIVRITLSQATQDRLQNIGISAVAGGYQNFVKKLRGNTNNGKMTLKRVDIDRLKKYSSYDKNGGYERLFRLILSDISV